MKKQISISEYLDIDDYDCEPHAFYLYFYIIENYEDDDRFALPRRLADKFDWSKSEWFKAIKFLLRQKLLFMKCSDLIDGDETVYSLTDSSGPEE